MLLSGQSRGEPADTPGLSGCSDNTAFNIFLWPLFGESHYIGQVSYIVGLFLTASVTERDIFKWRDLRFLGIKESTHHRTLK